MIAFRDLLVPIDFSAASVRALDFALALADARGEVVALHVVDADFVGRVAQALSACRCRRRGAPVAHGHAPTCLVG